MTSLIPLLSSLVSLLFALAVLAPLPSAIGRGDAR